MQKGFTTVTVSDDTYSRLVGRKISGNDSMESVIKNILDITTSTFDINAEVRVSKERIMLKKTKKDIGKIDTSILLKDVESTEKMLIKLREDIQNIEMSVDKIIGEMK